MDRVGAPLEPVQNCDAAIVFVLGIEANEIRPAIWQQALRLKRTFGYCREVLDVLIAAAQSAITEAR